MMLRLERIRVAIAAFRLAKAHCENLLKLLEEYLQ
jgi:hypothetical protein